MANEQIMSSQSGNESVQVLTEALLIVYNSFGEEYIATDIQLERLMQIVAELSTIDFTDIPK